MFRTTKSIGHENEASTHRGRTGRRPRRARVGLEPLEDRRVPTALLAPAVMSPLALIHTRHAHHATHRHVGSQTRLPAGVAGHIAAQANTPADGTHIRGKGYELFTFGNPGDAAGVSTSPGEVLMGGGTDVDEAFSWMGTKAVGGDFLVIRATGTDAYNPYINSLGTFHSVSTLIITKRDAAFDPFVLDLVQHAEALFIAGGDQADYVTLWGDTPLEDAIVDLAARAPIGGTSAGLAVMGETDFAALNGTLTSGQALADPYGRRVSLSNEFLSLPLLDNVITDSHFVTRDRMGRLVTFLARTVADGGNRNNGIAAPELGIGINEQTALLVEPTGMARVVSNVPDDPHSNVYLVKTPATLGGSDIVAARTPLTYHDVSVHLAHAGASFDLSDPLAWSGLPSYTLTADAGAVTSSSGDLYLS
jgi:cyanophycinase